MRNFLNRDIDNSQIILFRILFGILMVVECWGAIATGWVRETFVDPSFTFTFMGFEWTQFLLGPKMYVYYGIMGLLGIGIATGYRYRLSSALFFLLWTTTYFMQKSHYNNHYYLIVLISFWMVMVPANRWYSMDVKRKRVRQETSCPAWCRWVFIAQISIVYLYAAIAKLYPDWLNAMPVSIWMRSTYHVPFLRPLLTSDWFHYLISYAGIGFDFLIVPLLFWRKTRWLAIAASLVFHIFNSVIFQIGIFPYFALSMALFFFKPEEVRTTFFRSKPARSGTKDTGLLPMSTYLLILAWFFIQLLLPIRHWAIPGDVLWTEEGHRLSWRMMLRTKHGRVGYTVEFADGERRQVLLNEHLSPHQVKDVSFKPDMMWQFAQYLRKYYEMESGADVKVFVDAKVGVNGRSKSQLTDPEADLASIPWNRWGHNEWLLPRPF